jgi:tetratricopeptide (TPR) repeat protein
MKRKERHHLKENDLAASIIKAREAIERRQQQLQTAAFVVVVLAVVGGGFMWWQGRNDARAEQLLGEAMTALNARVIPASTAGAQPGELPEAATLGAVGSYSTQAAKLNAALPKLKAAADAYPDTDAGITARYHYASSLSALGRTQEAVQEFDNVVSRAGANSLYGRMSRLGKADTQMQAGQLDSAIATWKELASSNDENLPKDAILMELAKAYAAKGNRDEARKTFTQIIDEHPTSPYSAEARAELGS